MSRAQELLDKINEATLDGVGDLRFVLSRNGFKSKGPEHDHSGGTTYSSEKHIHPSGHTVQIDFGGHGNADHGVFHNRAGYGSELLNKNGTAKSAIKSLSDAGFK